METLGSPTKEVQFAKPTKTTGLCKLDKIMVEQKAKGENYADWQAQRYPIRAERPQSRFSI